MQRREFLASSVIGSVGTVMAISELTQAVEGSGKSKQLLELRRYQIATPEKRDRLEKFLAEVAIPVWNNLGIRPVGVFRYLEGEDPSLFVLLPHNTCETVIREMAALLSDPRAQAAGKEVLEDSFDDPTYQRVESSLLLAFDGERELTLRQGDTAAVVLRTDGPWIVDAWRVMQALVAKGFLQQGS